MPVRAAALPGFFLVALSVTAAGCSRPVDVKQAVQVDDLSGGWFDAGIVNGKNKLVPSISFRVKLRTSQTVRPLSLNVLFRTVDGQESSIDQDVFVQSVAFEGDSTKPIVVRPDAGYVGEGEQSRDQILHHSQFRDMRAVIFAKHSSSNWVEMARYDIPRQLLTK
jgi:hypothetical protein